MPFLALVAALLTLGAHPQPAHSPKPAAGQLPAQLLGAGEADRMAPWRADRFGMFVHWGLYAIPAGKWGESTTFGEWIRHEGKIPLPEYDKFVTQFNPTKFDASAIVRAAKNAGMKYIVITSKHHDGFCLFDTQTTDFDVMSTPFKRDILKELAEACRKEGIKLGWYYSIMDWHHPDYLPRRDWEKESDRPTKDASMDRYVEYMKAQLKELLTNYGDIYVLWFDGQWEHNWNDDRGRDLEAYVRKLQPGIIINSRVGKGGGSWGMDGPRLGDYSTPEQHIPDSAPGGDWETCMTMNDHWGYNAADKNFKSTQDLIHKLVDIASKGGNFLLNIGPTALGDIPPESVDRLSAIGRWMAANGPSIYGTFASPFPKPFTWGCCTVIPAGGPRSRAPDQSRLYLHVFDWPKDGRLVIPGIYNQPKAAHLLTDPARPFPAENVGDDIVITFNPGSPPDSIDTVVVLDLLLDPDVGIPPDITPGAQAGMTKPGEWIFTNMLNVTVGSSRPNIVVRFTLDGSEPTDSSTYTTSRYPLLLSSATRVTARCYRGGKPVSPISRATFTKVTPRPSVEAPGAAPGLAYQYFQFDRDLKSLNEMEAMQPIGSGVSPSLALDIRNRDKDWGAIWTGFVEVPTAGMYHFTLGSDDGSRLWIGDDLLIDNDKPHSYAEVTGPIALAKGRHPIKVAFFENWGGFDLKLLWSGPGIDKQPISQDRFSHADSP